MRQSEGITRYPFTPACDTFATAFLETYVCAIYLGSASPDTIPGERLDKRPIEITLRDCSEILYPTSRLNVDNIYTHNLPVCALGEVDRKDLPRVRHFREFLWALF